MVYMFAGTVMNTRREPDAAEVMTIIPPVQERVKKTNERLKADFSKYGSKIAVGRW